MPLIATALMDFATIKPILNRDTDEQSFIEYLLNVASGAIESFCGRKFCQARETIILDNLTPFNTLMAPEFPVYAVNALNVDPYSQFGAGTAVSDLLAESTGLVIVKDMGVPYGRQVAKLDYTRGYIPARLGGTCESFTIDFTNDPVGGTSFLFSTIGADGSAHKWQVWFKIGGVGAAPAAAAGFTLAEVDLTDWADAHLAPYLAAAVDLEISVSVLDGVATITNAYPGSVPAPADVDTGSIIAVLSAGAAPAQAIDTTGALWIGSPENLPMAIQEAVVETVLWYAGRLQQRNVGERFTSRDGLNITFEIELPKNVQGLLSSDKRLA